MSLEAIVTRLEITPNGELYAGFRNLGGIFFPWKNLFFTKSLGTNSGDFNSAMETNLNYERVRRQIKDNAALRNFKDRLKTTYYWIYQLFAPINIKDLLPDEFIIGGYTPKARYQLANPGTFVSLEDKVVDALQSKKIIDGKIFELKSRINTARKKSYATRTFNILNNLFENYSGNFQQILEKAELNIILKKLDVGFIQSMMEISELVAETNKRLDGVSLTYTHDSKNRRSHFPRVEMQNYDFLKHWRKMTADEFFGMKWLFIDIEIPNFRNENAGITWVGIKIYDNGDVVNEIYTTHSLQEKEIGSYKIFKSDNPAALIEKLSTKINYINPDVVVSYTNFDLVELKESEVGFPIGEKETNPLFKVTTPFFERISVKDRLVIDFMRWQRIARIFDINAKLEMAVGFEKELGYDELEALENGSIEGKTKIAEYLASDVDRLSSIFLLDEFKKCTEDILWISAEMCNDMSINIERLFHNPNTINDIQERNYLIKNGIFRSEVPPYFKTKDNQKKEKNSGDTFEQFINDKIIDSNVEGLVKDVHKVYIPIGDFFRRQLALQSDDIKRFFEYKDQFRDDKKRLFFLEQYAKSLARWMITDIGSFIREKVELNGMISPFEPLPNGFFRERKFLNPDDFKEFFEQEGKLRRHNNRFSANYKVGIQNVFSEINRRAEEINKFLAKNNFQIVAREGYYLYLIGDESALLEKDSPVVAVDKIPKLYNADKPYYKKHGFISHMRIEDDPTYHLCVFEMDALGDIINHLLDGRHELTRLRFDIALNDLRKCDIPVEDLIFRNESKERYFAFTKDGYKTSKTHFVLEGRFLRDPVLTDYENELSYYEDSLSGKNIRIYHLDFGSLEINHSAYFSRIFERGKRILAPVMEKQLEIF